MEVSPESQTRALENSLFAGNCFLRISVHSEVDYSPKMKGADSLDIKYKKHYNIMLSLESIGKLLFYLVPFALMINSPQNLLPSFHKD